MDARRREFAREIFALTTELVDRMQEQAIDGQSPHISQQRCLKIAEHLRESAANLLVLVDAVTTIIGLATK